eukprot:CAMPEP_0178409168 /NCGR_PEP_ID=MMETSP0689_2-20121128/20324_1 /TAXON_ID=160604 /ORGANISM="Amphidinium massartii, Strain CS-259" /LENGTH=57 /DNA_ID=CAMNT_0020030303 /DNA_START=582 /DNA_END=755 /DNA_ORIENTATION=-
MAFKAAEASAGVLIPPNAGSFGCLRIAAGEASARLRIGSAALSLRLGIRQSLGHPFS